MRRFEFRLESLRALREQAEEQAKTVLGRELALEAMRRASVDAAAGKLSRAGAHPVGDGIDLVGRQAYVERCERELVAAQHQLAQTRGMVTSRRNELGEAARQRQTLERLKERQRELHDAEAQRAEEAVLSEVGLTLYRSRVA